MINTKSKPKIYQKYKIIIANNDKIQLNCHLEIKEFIVHFISYNIDSIQTNFNELEPKEKLLFIEKLLKYVLPQNFEIETPKEETIITIEG